MPSRGRPWLVKADTSLIWIGPVAFMFDVDAGPIDELEFWRSRTVDSVWDGSSAGPARSRLSSSNASAT